MTASQTSAPVGHTESEPRLRWQYAGAIGLLCELSTRIRDPEDKDMLDQAVADWCAISGWSWRRVLDRVEVFPPEIES